MINPVNTNSVPLSTRVIQSAGEAAEKNVVPGQTDPSIVATPENVNKAVDYAADGVANKQQTEQANQEAIRSLVVDVNHAQHQQDLVDQYIAQSTDTNESSPTVNVYELAQQQKKTNTIETLSNVSEAKDRFSDAITPSEPSRFHIQA
ncbi:hypothetical protein [Thalassotalea sp. PLHSN55]|uniref:hypothetical protein n=1 Tax=Thalassotalea sp. PLHSN55 TaxID=3435888 RepID=UPI003F859CB3